MDWTFNWCDVARATIDMLPDVALLEIFDFYVRDAYYRDRRVWHTLVHVCRKWRFVAFGSPRRLDLRLICGARTPVRETLDVWPRFPIIIYAHTLSTSMSGNILAGLEHNDRVCEMYITAFSRSRTENVWAALQQPFPALTRLEFLFQFLDEAAPVVSASFLGGSAPALQTLWLDSTPFPGIPNFLLSATHLVYLRLTTIPHSGYFSPEAMVTALSVLTRLECLQIAFNSPRSRPDQNSRRLPPQTRTLLPVLTELTFNGAAEYLENLVAQVDAPLLDKLKIDFFYELMIFDTLRLTQFISRTPNFRAHDEARLTFDECDVAVKLPRTFYGAIRLRILCNESDLQLSSLAQVCSSSFPPALIPAVERLYIDCMYCDRPWEDDIEDSQWIELFRPFVAVKRLYISSDFMPQIATALQELGESTPEVLPALEMVFFEKPLLSGPVQEAIGEFVAAQEFADHPITISPWNRGEDDYESDCD